MLQHFWSATWLLEDCQIIFCETWLPCAPRHGCQEPSLENADLFCALDAKRNDMSVRMYSFPIMRPTPCPRSSSHSQSLHSRSLQLFHRPLPPSLTRVPSFLHSFIFCSIHPFRFILPALFLGLQHLQSDVIFQHLRNSLMLGNSRLRNATCCSMTLRSKHMHMYVVLLGPT